MSEHLVSNGMPFAEKDLEEASKANEGGDREGLYEWQSGPVPASDPDHQPTTDSTGQHLPQT